MRIPRLNRLTGPFWWREAVPRDDSDATRRRQEEHIIRLLRSPETCAIGKLGTTEMLGLEYLERWLQPPWPPAASWRRPAQRLYECSGLFPVRRDIFLRWAQIYQESLGTLDVVSQWQPGMAYEGVLEGQLLAKYSPRAFRAGLSFVHLLMPKAPWLDDLPRLRWLVVSPFPKTIRHQLPRLSGLGVYSPSCRESLERRAEDTVLVPSPPFAYMVPPRHRDWFQALEEMKAEMEKAKGSFDIALVGAGAWSLPLVAHAKKVGKKGMHLGGSLQLLFGIKGGRYDGWGVYNGEWIRPLPKETPENFRRMEKGAYW